MKTYLIGAGPGDPSLLTLKGKAILERADVVVYDYLASETLLQMIRPDAERIYVGKIAGNHAMKQDDINALLIEKTRAGKIVARLKGGDPYIFGRGGEEAEALAKAGLAFEEVPGISSAIAAPAYAGIPLTHRGYASSVTIITGHENPDKPESVHNWEALAASASTLVFVMGMKNLPNIATNLINAGLDPQTPAALIHWGTTPKQKSLVAPLVDLPQAALDQGFTNPSVIVVGSVVSLRDTLNWFEKQPLHGVNVVVTRSREQASDLALQLEERGAQVILFPTISIVPLKDTSELNTAIKNLQSYDWLIFTSVNGVDAFFAQVYATGHDARAMATTKVAVIGSATAKALQKYGIIADFMPQKFIAESLAKGLCELGIQGKRICLARAREARDVLPDTLTQAGALLDIVPVYETRPANHHKDEVLTHLKAGTLHAVSFGSSSTVRHFFEQISPETLQKHILPRFVCIGPITAKTLEEYGFTADIMPDAYTIPAMVQAIEHAFSPNLQKDTMKDPQKGTV